MPRPRKGARILPPISAKFPEGLYRHGKGFRFVSCPAVGGRVPSEVYLSKGEAIEARALEQAVIDGRTDVTRGRALEDYGKFMAEEGHRNEGGNKPGAVEDTLYKIGVLLPDEEMLLEELADDKKCQGLYDELRKRIKPSTRTRCQKAAAARDIGAGRKPAEWKHAMGPVVTPEAVRGKKPGPLVFTKPFPDAEFCLCEPYAADSHRQMLLETKTFLRWCITKGFIAKSGMETIRGKGKRKEGKDQLSVDDGRKWVAQAMFNASVRGEDQAIACMMTVYMGLSGTEITDRLVGDVDDNCTRLWITNGKTRNREKAVDIPDDLQPFVQVLCEGRQPTDRLWTGRQHWRDWINHGVQKICEQAGVKVVTGHGMRGLYGTLNLLGGAEEDEARVAAKMRHAPGTFASTAGPKYMNPTALRRTIQRRALGVLKGGKSD